MQRGNWRTVGRAALCALALAAQSAAGAKQPSSPAGPAWVKKTVQTCANCHGAKGVAKIPTFPVLAGQYQSYLYHALTGYRDGARKNAIMATMVKGKSDAQLKALARYFSRQQSPLRTPGNSP